MELPKKIVAFAGPSGVGKSTLSNILMHYSNAFEFSVSATTRSIRLGEKHGHDYYFLSEEEFKKQIDEGLFLEYEEVYPGRFYGTLRSEVSRINEAGNIAVLDIDVLGALSIKKEFGDQAFVIFVKPESIESLKERLKNRGTENEEQIQVRVDRFKEELGHEHDFDAILVNATGKLEEAKDELLTLIEKEFPGT